jgi:hypothetical protein
VTTKIMPCKCPNKYQDEKYGAGKRVHTVSREGGNARCTVCADVKMLVKK